MAQPTNTRLVTEAALSTAIAGVNHVLLEAGQTVADYETANTTTVPVGTIVFQKA